MADKKTKVIFHIVNSIKGGSGKSTISFLLADHYNQKEKNEAVIIDLDVNGSSWAYDHKIDNPYGCFLQDYMYKPEKIESSDGMKLKYHYIKDDGKSGEEKALSVFLSDPKRNFQMSDCEIDLFENVIYNIIKQVIISKKFENTELLHIILDMPPSYEAHADRIINHLLIDINSPLYKKYKGEYIVIHHLVCACIYSHIKLNQHYMKEFKENNSYSNTINSLLKDRKYNFIFTLNDLHDRMFDNWGDNFTPNQLWAQFSKKARKELNPKIAWVKHIDLPKMTMADVLKPAIFNVYKQSKDAMDVLIAAVEEVLKSP